GPVSALWMAGLRQSCEQGREVRPCERLRRHPRVDEPHSRHIRAAAVVPRGRRSRGDRLPLIRHDARVVSCTPRLGLDGEAAPARGHLPLLVGSFDPRVTFLPIAWLRALGGAQYRAPLTAVDQRSDLNAARSSSEKSWGCSQAAKCPPFSTSL